MHKKPERRYGHQHLHFITCSCYRRLPFLSRRTQMTRPNDPVPKAGRFAVFFADVECRDGVKSRSLAALRDDTV